MSDSGVLATVAYIVLRVLCFLRNKIFPRCNGIPEPDVFLKFLLTSAFRKEKLYILEFLTDFYNSNGLFKYDSKIYVFDPKLSQTAINKLEKGAENYLENSPLKDTFLGSSSRSPEVRRAIAALFRKTTLEERGRLIINDVQNMCSKMQKDNEINGAVNITDWALRMAMDVVGHMLLELDLHALEGDQTTLLECLMTILHHCYALAEISPDGPEFKEANEKFEELTTKILENALNKEDDPNEEKRLVKKLHEACGFEHARDNMKLFLMAGSETTASTIPVVFYLLTTYPDLQAELQSEADENIDSLLKDPALSLPKLEAVMKEILRVYPIAPFISRRTHAPVTVGDIHLEENSDLIIFTWGIHRSNYNWNSAKVFQPFRFLNTEKRSMYIPFGAGSRICIGQHLAWLELKLALSLMLNRFSFSKVPQTPDLKFVVDWAHAVVHPDQDMYFKLKPRH